MASLGAIAGAGHDDGERGALGAGDQPFAAVDDEAVAVGLGAHLQHGRIGAGAAVGLGHGEAGAYLAGREALQILLALRGRRDHIEQMDVALVGRMKVQRDGAEDGVAGRLEDDGLLEVRETLAAEVLGTVDAEQAGCLGGGVEVAAQVLGDAVMPPARIRLERNDLLANEGGDAIAQLGERLGDLEVHASSALLAKPVRGRQEKD